MQYKKSDYLHFALIVALILFLALLCLDNSCYWGDDFAAYISEGIAIAEGRLQHQAEINVLMHPSALPDETRTGTLVYVWGYPLLLAIIYCLFGFDRTTFATIIYYKLPSAVAMALLAGVLYLYLRRRFGNGLSFVLAFIFCAAYEFRVFINTMYSDIVFIFFAMLSLLMAEIFLDEERVRPKIIKGIILGVLMWFTYEIRLNGISIIFACALEAVIACCRRIKSHIYIYIQRETTGKGYLRDALAVCGVCRVESYI